MTSLNRPIRVLLVEDSEADAELLVLELRRGGYEPSYRRVASAEDFLAALDSQPWDVILCDYTMPGFSGTQALALVRSRGFDVPFIYVSGTIGEETAVAAMKAGAQDYVLKDHLMRLVPAIERELREIEVRHDRARADADRRAAEARFREVLAMAPDAIVAADEDQRITIFNRAAEAVFGYRADEVLGQFLDLLLPSRFVAAHRQHLDEFMRSPDVAKRMDERREIIGRRKNGEEFPAEASISKLVENGRTTFMAVVRDVSRRKLMEEQLLQAQKMQAIGQFAGGIAHDFNNMLLPIISLTGMTKNGLPADSPLHENLAVVIEAATQAARLVKQIMTFSHQAEKEVTDIDISQCLEEAAQLLDTVLPSSVRLDAHVEPDVGTVVGDRAQLHSVMLNLGSNAAHAMGGKTGRLTLGVSRIVADQDFAVRREAIIEGKAYAKLTVSDTGCGMNEATLKKIFDPFFTTKPVGEGTGLGLAMVYGVVQGMNGTIDVSSEVDVGTTFDIYLPLHGR